MTQDLWSSLEGVPATWGHALWGSHLPSSSLYLREVASVAVEPMSWGCSLERSDLASSHFQASPVPPSLTSLHDTGVVTNDQD